MFRTSIYITFQVIISLQVTTLIQSFKPACPCSDKHLCNSFKFGMRVREDIVIAEGTENYKSWPWKDITTVIATEINKDKHLMCTAHQNKANYGFIATVPDITNTSSLEFTTWLQSTKDRETNSFTDFVALDFLDLLDKCHKTEKHIEDVLNVFNAIYVEFPIYKAHIICIMPYKPPCFHGNCSLVDLMKEKCEMFITSPDSYLTCDTNTKCVAMATMPMTSAVFGIEEYVNHEVDVRKLVMGIPWHGYDYKCERFSDNQCFVAKNATSENKEVCDTKNNRKKITISELQTKYSKQFTQASLHKFSNIYRANVFNIKVKDIQHQIWYEGFDSLLDKYMFAKDLSLGGIAVWTGDDLSGNGINGEEKWNWIHHQIFKDAAPTRSDFNVAGTVAGLGVGCFILGSLLGFGVGCALMRRRNNKKGLRLPFQKDEDDETDFHDDDNVL